MLVTFSIEKFRREGFSKPIVSFEHLCYKREIKNKRFSGRFPVAWPSSQASFNRFSNPDNYKNRVG